uniref:Uncharacterized protein n=1 Tax=Rhizophora mucronata TaxID=61149 RepID=A0A2P2QH10_RHIMU
MLLSRLLCNGSRQKWN